MYGDVDLGKYTFCLQQTFHDNFDSKIEENVSRE